MAQIVDSIFDLRATLPNNPNPLSAILRGYYQKDDKPHLVYYWDNNSFAEDNGGSVIAVTGVAGGRWVCQFPSQLNPRHFGAKGDGQQSDTEALQKTIDYLNEGGGGAVRFDRGTYLIDQPLTLKTNVTLSGVLPQVSVLKINIADKTLSACSITSEVDVNDTSLLVSNLSVIDTRPADKKSVAPVFDLDGLLNTQIYNCQFRDLGGSAIRIGKSSNTSISNIYAFGCGKGLATGTNEFTDIGIIHMDRSKGYSNTLNMSDNYISNCSDAIGINVAGHAIRLNNCTVESCRTLLRLGSTDHVSRNLVISGLYLENARFYGMELTNLINANFQNVYYRDSNVAKKMMYSVLMDNCRDVLWENANLGEYGFDVRRTSTNIQFRACSGNYPKEGLSGVNDNSSYGPPGNSYGDFGQTANWIENSNDLSQWKGNALTQSIDGSTFLLKKSQKSDDIRYNISSSFTAGTKMVFSVFTEGPCSLRIRAKRAGAFENLVLRQFQQTSDVRRIYVSEVLKSSVDAISLHITPMSYGRDTAECEISDAQFEVGKLIPGPFIRTNGAVSNVAAMSVNGGMVFQGLYRGLASGPPSSGNWNQGDKIENSTPKLGEPLGWVCISSGSPGSWHPYGRLE